MAIQPTQSATAPIAARAVPNDRALKTAKDFESVFIGQMTKIMMETAAPQDGTFSGGHGEEMFRGVMAEQLGGAIVARGGLGLTPVVLDQIARMQGDANVR